MSADQDFQSAIRHHQAGLFPESEEAYRRAIKADASHAGAWERLGILLHQSGRSDAAIDALQRAAELRPQAPSVQSNLGAVLAAAGRWNEARDAFGKALSLGADFPQTHYNLGNVMRELGRVTEAIAAYRRAVGLWAEYADAWNSLGTLLRIEGDLDAASTAFSHAVELRPAWAEAINNLGGVYHETRQVDEAAGLFRRALALKNDPRIWDNLLLSLHGQEGMTPENLRDEHAKWNQSLAAPFEHIPHTFANDTSPERRLRIGYVSPDFREHPVGRLMTPVLANHDHSQFEIFCYSDVKGPDAITEMHRKSAHHWIDSASLTDDQLADRVVADQIDVLIDLTLHTGNNRLLVFARRRAPVQLTWAGYPGSTGLTTINYRLTDPHLDPVHSGREALYSEKLFRLPHSFWCFDPQTQDPAVNELRALHAGAVTFGCLNQFGKISDATLTRWSAVMNAVPASRLLILAPRGNARDALSTYMAKMGVTPDRIGFLDRRPRPQYLKFYHEIDICLDTFPYTGHTTTIDALWMGVPVVTMYGATTVSRGGLSIMCEINLTELIAKSDTEFVEKAAYLAQDLGALSRLRTSLRQRLMASPIADCARFTRDIESSIRFAWRSWCDSERIMR